MADIAQLGIQIESKTAIKAVDDLDDLTLAAQRAENAATDLGAASRKMTPALSGVAKGSMLAGNNSRMMAMQLSQVAQQASATGNIVQALAIQLPDMAMGFGTVGIAAGVLASVALPLLASAFTGAGDEGKALADTLENMSGAVDTFTSSAAAAAAPMEQLVEKYGRMAEEAQRALAAIAAADQLNAMDAIKQSIDQVTNSLLQTVTAREALADGTSTRQLIDDYDLLRSQARAVERALGDLEKAQGLEAQVAAASRLMRALDDARNKTGQLPPPLQAAYDAVARIVPKAAEANAKTDQMAALLRLAASAADAAAAAVSGIGSAASNAYGAVADLASKLWEVASAKAAAVAPGNLARTGDDGRGSQRPTVAGSRTNMPDQPWMNTGGGGGGGGGGGSDPFAENLQALVENLKTQRETEDQWYQENLAILQDRRAQEILGKQEHDAAMIALHEEYQRRIAEIDAEAQQQRLGDTANLFGALASVAQAGGQRMAKIAATFQAVEGTVNAYGAAIKALNTPGLTLAGRFAAYASVLAAGLKGVMGIRQAGGIGGGSGGRTVAQGATAATVQRSSELTVNVDPNALLTATMWDQIFEGVFGAAKARGMTSFSGIRFA